MYRFAPGVLALAVVAFAYYAFGSAAAVLAASTKLVILFFLIAAGCEIAGLVSQRRSASNANAASRRQPRRDIVPDPAQFLSTKEREQASIRAS